jgi:hypothetical protein
VALDAGVVEPAHLAVRARGQQDQGHRERGAARFPEPQPQVEQRLEPKLG